LKFSRLGRKPIQKSKINLNLIVKQVFGQFKDDIEKRDIKIKIDHLPIVSGDNSLLQIVFENLISNAIKFTSRTKHPRIEIGTRKEGNKTSQIFIQDNGAGFDMVYAGKLFNVFQRLHTSDEFEGTGIGLANVRQLIHKHGWTIHAEGQVNKGATFFIDL
jgi:light-regulated signal transduction histidine kinase (bacteriophytochrome)